MGERRETEQRARDVGAWRERAGANRKQLLHATHGLHTDRECAVRLRARPRRNAIGHFGLDEKHDARRERRWGSPVNEGGGGGGGGGGDDFVKRERGSGRGERRASGAA